MDGPSKDDSSWTFTASTVSAGGACGRHDLRLFRCPEYPGGADDEDGIGGGGDDDDDSDDGR